MNFVYYYEKLNEIIIVYVSNSGIVYQTKDTSVTFDNIEDSFIKISKELHFLGFL